MVLNIICNHRTKKRGKQVMTTFVPITRYSRCKRYAGAKIACPNCNTITTTGHLSWTSKKMSKL